MDAQSFVIENLSDLRSDTARITGHGALTDVFLRAHQVRSRAELGSKELDN
jgi:hypothetical protein